MPPPTGLQEHLAALSPYFSIYRQPPAPASRKVASAVYLFRHGILEVSQHDYKTYIAPFLQKLLSLQESQVPFARGPLSPLLTYRSWITNAHVGMVSKAGLQQSADLGRAFRIRYSQWLKASSSSQDRQGPLMKVWTDSATRCRLTAIAFAEAFSGKVGLESEQVNDDLPQLDTQVSVSFDEDSPGTCNNLSWHTALHVDQQVGNEQMSALMKVTTANAYKRLKRYWLAPDTFGSEDIYALQLLHCYDVVSERQSPFEGCFEPDDWLGFEYLRDTKYHYSEGYGCADAGSYAVPWMAAALRKLGHEGQSAFSFPLHVAFTHREEVLYLCCLLGICYEHQWAPDLTRVDEDRQWRVSQLAPYLGHVGIETYYQTSGNKRVRIIINGNVMPAFLEQLEQDQDGGYNFDAVNAWLDQKPCKWEGFKGL